MSNLQTTNNKESLEEELFRKVQLLIDALDNIITINADSGTLKKYAKEALNHIMKEGNND
tara:strand:- start:13175 stop:13354 length:180 start_codon:yes stop_codon:yes gene_type:complete